MCMDAEILLRPLFDVKHDVAWPARTPLSVGCASPRDPHRNPEAPPTADARLAATYGAAGLPGPGESLIRPCTGDFGGWAKEDTSHDRWVPDPYVSPGASAFSLSRAERGHPHDAAITAECHRDNEQYQPRRRHGLLLPKNEKAPSSARGPDPKHSTAQPVELRLAMVWR